MGLYDELVEKDKKGIFTSDDNLTTYSTGLLVLDYANGYWTDQLQEDGTIKPVPVIGLQAGSLVSIIGTTGTGKSTLAAQIGYSIIKPYEDGILIFDDCEKTANRQRICNIVNAPYDEPRIIINKSNTSIDDVLLSVNQICDIKEAGGRKFMYEAEDKTRAGKKFWQYVPTVHIIDSLPSFNSKEYNVEDLGNQIDQMKASKDITRFYTNILDRAWKYNIIFIVINHIRANPAMNPYQMPPQGLLMINPKTENLPRGSVPQYFSNTYFRIKTTKSAAYTMEDDGFTGQKCDIVLAKTKTNRIGTSFPVAMSGERGFDPLYSIYEFANSLGLVQGRNPYLKLTGFDERKFNRKEFNSLMTVDQSFREGVLSALRPYYESLLGTKRPEGETTEQYLAYGDTELSFT